MNKARIREVALALLTGSLATRSKNPIGYNQTGWKNVGITDRSGHNCGTTACIGGTTVALFEPRKFRGISSIEHNARRILGLNDTQGDRLFAACPLGIDAVSSKQAALVLFHLAETGRVDWSLARGVEATGSMSS